MPVPIMGLNKSKMVFEPNNGILGASPILRFTEYNAVMTIMPDKSCKMPSLTFSQAVIKPAIAPAKKPMLIAKMGLNPDVMHTAHANAPNGKLPSAVKSGKSNTRKDNKTPNATSAKINPVSNVPNNAINDIIVFSNK